MSDKEDTSLVLRPSGELARRPSGATAIIDSMVNDATEIIRTDAIRHRIGDYEFRESDYRQILIWAEATDLQPEKFLGGMNLIVSDGAIVSLEWHNLEVGVELDLSRVPHLEELFCGRNCLTALDLSRVPHLKKLDCSRNDLTELDLSRVPHLETLNCDGNDLTELDLSRVSYLKRLYCAANHLTELDLSRVPYLEELFCQEGNSLTKLDISGLKTSELIIECDSDVRIHKRDDQHPTIFRT